MANCINYNCDDLPEYESTIGQCSSKTRNGGASIIYLLECDATVADPGNQTEIDALVLAGTATEISGIKFGFGAPSAVTVDPITSCGSIQTINYDRTFNLEDAKVSATNTTFWSTAKKRTFGGLIAIECSTSGLTDVVTFIDAEIDIEAYRDFPNSNSAIQKYIVTGKWKDIDDPEQIVYTP